MGAKISVELRHNGTDLEPTELGTQAKNDIKEREESILNSGDAKKIKAFKTASAASKKEHKNDPKHQMIVLSQKRGDEIEWRVTDANGKLQKGFTVRMTNLGPAVSPDIQDNPFENKQLDDKGTGQVISGPPVDGVVGNRYHYEVKMKAQRAALDPDCYIFD